MEPDTAACFEAMGVTQPRTARIRKGLELTNLNLAFGVGASATIAEGHAELSNTIVLSLEQSKDYLTTRIAQQYQLPYSVSRVLVNALDISCRKLHDGIVHLENFGSDIFQYARELLTKGEGK